MKGIWQQIREDNTAIPSKLTKKGFREFFERGTKERIIQIKANEKSRKENWKHLVIRIRS